MPHLSGFASFDFNRDEFFNFYHLFLSSFLSLETVHLCLTILVAQRREIRGLATNLTLENSIFHKEVFEGPSMTRQGSFPFKKTF